MSATTLFRTHRQLARRVFNVAGFIASLLLSWYLWPASLGGDTHFVVVQGSSMEPTFHLGEAIMVKDNPSPEVGDIIVFNIPADEPAGGMLVIHRVRSIRPDGSYETQGDNRATPDTFHTTDGDVMGSPVHAVPHVGRLIGLASKPIVVALATGSVAVMLLWPKRRHPEEPDSDETSEDDDTSGGDGAGNGDEPGHHERLAEQWLATELEPIGADLDAQAQAWLEAELAALDSEPIDDQRMAHAGLS